MENRRQKELLIENAVRERKDEETNKVILANLTPDDKNNKRRTKTNNYL